jgi:mRNA interferase RelE/StbE
LSSNFKVEITTSAAKEFKKLPNSIKDKVKEMVGFLEQNPRSEFLNIKKMKGPADLYRVRIGDYRMVYEIKENKIVILIIKLGHRKEVYNKL